MATQTGGGAPAPARIYRWEPDTIEPAIDGMLLRTDDDRPQEQAGVARCWDSWLFGGWVWLTRDGTRGREVSEADARRACLLAVLHAPDADEPGGAGR